MLNDYPPQLVFLYINHGPEILFQFLQKRSRRISSLEENWLENRTLPTLNKNSSPAASQADGKIMLMWQTK